jgi:hypothetical protein
MTRMESGVVAYRRNPRQRSFTRVLGRRVACVQVPWDQFRQNTEEDTTKMYRWFNDIGYHADIDALRREYPALATLEEVLRQEDWLAGGMARQAA